MFTLRARRILLEGRRELLLQKAPSSVEFQKCDVNKSASTNERKENKATDLQVFITSHFE